MQRQRQGHREKDGEKETENKTELVSLRKKEERDRQKRGDGQ